MIAKFLALMNRNPALTLVGALCILDAILIISGLAGTTPWSHLFVNEVQGAIPKKLELTALGITHVVAWTIVPPIWFFIESFALDDHLLPTVEHATNLELKAKYDRLLLAQELGAKVWAAVLAAILFLAPK